MTCRDEVLAAARAIFSRTGANDFSIEDILAELRRQGSTYADSTVRTEITSRLCRDAPAHHAVRYPDFVRRERSRYALSDVVIEPSRDLAVGEHRITAEDLKRARVAFDAHEPRDVFYRVATKMVDTALRGGTPPSFSLADALAVLLQTWNKAHYQYHKFDNAHFASIEGLLSKHKTTLAGYRGQAIDDLRLQEKTTVVNLFQAFEDVLGPVGAAKVLHLLAPRLFPLWDNAIAKAYKLRLGKRGLNGERYWSFVLISQRQCLDLKREDPGCSNPLKAIDEYNYCKYTGRWLS
jgi:hypothetical protein